MILHSKHTSLLNARFVLSARASFDYQKKAAPNSVQGKVDSIRTLPLLNSFVRIPPEPQPCGSFAALVLFGARETRI